MARVTLKPEIESISGKIGKFIFRTYKNGQVRAYKAPDYHRSTPPSEKEIKARRLFALRVKRVTELMALGVPKQEAWTVARSEIN